LKPVIGVGLNTLVNQQQVFQEVQIVETTVDNKSPEEHVIEIEEVPNGNILLLMNGMSKAVAIGADETVIEDAISALYPGFCASPGTCVTKDTYTTTESGSNPGGVRWNVTYSGIDGPVDPIAVDATGNAAYSSGADNTVVTRVTRTEGTAAINGTFSLSFNGSRTIDLPFNVSATNMEFALQDLPDINTVSIVRSSLNRNAYSWTITFDDLAGDIEMLYATAGRLTGSNVDISVKEHIPGTEAELVYDGTGIPDVRRMTFKNLVPDNTYSFKVAPLNALGKGVLSDAMDTIVATSGSSATYTTVSGSSLVKGITNDVDEEQVITATACQANENFTVVFNGKYASFNQSTTEVHLEHIFHTQLGEPTVDIDNKVEGTGNTTWRVIFRDRGDVPLLKLVSYSASCSVSSEEFLKGNRNQFTIEPKKADGKVLRARNLTAAGFEGMDQFLTETFVNGEWYADQGIAQYNPVVYEIQSIFIETADEFNLTLTDYRVPYSTKNFTSLGIKATSTLAEVQTAIESLENVGDGGIDVSMNALNGFSKK
jgi:hypothetical protein